MQYKMAILASLLLSTALQADMANGDPRLQKLYGEFISPCCWKENLLAHHSPKADELRAEIKRLVAAGRSDEQIKAAFTGQFSIRILSEPEGVRGHWLWWTPIAVALAGLGLLMLAIRRLRRLSSAVPAWNNDNLPEWEDESNYADAKGSSHARSE